MQQLWDPDFPVMYFSKRMQMARITRNTSLNVQTARTSTSIGAQPIKDIGIIDIGIIGIGIISGDTANVFIINW